jgi:putative ABC transport system permease protein
MVQGRIEDLRYPDAVIVNKVGAETKLARPQGPGKPSIPLRVGDQLELNDKRAYVVGICNTTRTFQSNPVIYTTFNHAMAYSPFERKLLSFILVKPTPQTPSQELCKKINKITGLAAYTRDDFKTKTLIYYLKHTGMPINFGLAVLLGLLIGAAIAGQIFYNFIASNLKYLSLFAVMGAPHSLLVKMATLQALWVALIGWGLGSGWVALIGFLSRKTELSFHLTWWTFLGGGLALLLICFVALLVSIRQIFKIELWTMFK